MHRLPADYYIVVFFVVVCLSCKHRCDMPMEDPMPDASAICGSVMQFNGINQYASVPAYDALQLDTGDFTFEARIKASSTQSDFPIVLSFRSSTDDGFLFGLWTDGQPFVQVGGSTGNWVAPAGKDLRDNTFHHIAVSAHNNGTLSYYIDGESAGTLTFNRSIRRILSPGPLIIGADIPSSNNTFFNGIIKDIRIWNTGRTANEIKTTMDISFSDPQAGLAGHWLLCEKNGQTIYNHIHSGADGFLGSSAQADVNDPVRIIF